jgi:hypothetical protein
VPNQTETSLRTSLQSIKPWLYLFYIWGAELLLSGVLGLLGEESSLKTIKLSLLLVAILVSLVLLLFQRAPIPNLIQLDLKKAKYTTLLPLAIIVGSSILLWVIEASDQTLILHVVRAQLLAFLYVLLGTFLGKQLIWLGVWLFALIVIVSLWYLGYVPLVFEAMGGLSLMVCGWVLINWSRGEDLT